MDTPKKNKNIGAIYIEKNKASLYATNFSKPFVITFPQDVVANMEIADISKFEQLLNTFITKNEIQSMSIFILLGKDVVLEKELANIPLSLQAAEEEKFLDMVPLHNVVSKAYNFNAKTILVAADKTFLEHVIRIFQEAQFLVMGVISASVLEEKFPTLKEKFDEKLLFKKASQLKQYFLPLGLEQQDKILSYEVPSFKNIQFIVLVSIFTLLLLILGVLVYTQILSPKHVQLKPVVEQQVEPTATPTVEPTPSTGSGSTTLEPTTAVQGVMIRVTPTAAPTYLPAKQ